ncbi:MAG: ABC transporter permease [Clostridia bacterium]|nr:ABC transporter permease [Clostridia bacterium]
MKVFKELFAYRELLKTNISKDVRGKYKNSFLGVFWSFLNPLLQITVYALIFPLLMRGGAVDNYTVFICCGLIPWTFFATAISRASFTIVENGNIVKKVYFPREILPISVVTSEAINFIISTVIILAFVIGYGVGISKYIIFYPVVLIVQYFLLMGISFIVSSITVFFRDLQHFIGITLQLLFYATPIVYAPGQIPQEFQWIIQYNPMTYVINGFRSIFYYKEMPDLASLGLVFGISIIITIIGYWIFKRLQKRFAEEI